MPVFLFLITAVWAYVLFHFAGVVPQDRRVYLLALGVVGLAWWLVYRRQSIEAPRIHRWTACLLPGYLALQLVPLPPALLSVVSPARLEILRGVQTLVPSEKTAPLSVSPEATMDQLLLFCGYAVLFFMINQLTSGFAGRCWLVMLPVIVVALLESILGIFQALSGTNVSGTYVNRDHYAGLLEMAFPFALAYPASIWGRIDTRLEFPLRPALVMILCFGTAVVILIGILSSLSRMGFLAPLFSVLVMGVVAWRGTGRRFTGLIALLAVLLVGSFVFLPSDQLIARFADVPVEMTAEGRLLLWRESLSVARAFPVFGCGMGAYEPAYLRYKVSAPMVSDDHVHNDYLQFLIELGVAGFLIGAVFFTAVVVITWRAANHCIEPTNRYLAIGSLGALAAIGLHSLVDFNLYIPANAMLLAWICGAASALSPAVTRECSALAAAEERP